MDFSGIEKFSLLDYEKKVCCILFVAGCDYRCPFCQNSSLVIHPENAPKIPFDEVLAYLKKRKGLVDAVCISGGEPTLMPDLENKIRAIRELGYLVKLDTNGTRPEIVEDLLNKNLLDYIAMDIKNGLSSYSATVGMEKGKERLEEIQKSIKIIINSHVDYEFRTTLVANFHLFSDIKEMGELLKGSKKLFLQKFVNSENCIVHYLKAVPLEEAKKFRDYLVKYIDRVELRGYE